MTARAVVTGGSGFVGSHLADALLDRGYEVVVFDRRPPPQGTAAAAGARFVEGDVRDPDACARAVGAGTDVVFHLSAVVGVHHYLADPLGVIDVNVGGTRNVLQAVLERGSRFLLASTSEVFGRNPKTPWAEDDDRVLGSTRVSRWSYSTSKAVAEHMVFAAHDQHGLAATVVRFFNAYGPRQARGYVISESVRRALRGEPLLVYDGGAQTRCFTFVADAVAGTVAAAESPDAVGEAFNLGSDVETPIREAVRLVAEVTGTTAGVEDVDTAARFGAAYEDIGRRVPDVTKAKQILGFEAATPLRHGIGATVAWARANPWWWR